MKETAKIGIAIIVIGLLLIILCMSSCVTQKRCNEKFPPSEKIIHEHTTETIRKDSLLPGAVVRVEVPGKDSMIIVNRWIKVTDEKGLAELRYKLDSLGNVTEMECEANERMIEAIRTVSKDYVNKMETKVLTTNIIPKWIWIIFGMMIMVIIYLRFKNFSIPDFIKKIKTKFLRL